MGLIVDRKLCVDVDILFGKFNEDELKAKRAGAARGGSIWCTVDAYVFNIGSFS